jgi:hypothetical protein
VYEGLTFFLIGSELFIKKKKEKRKKEKEKENSITVNDVFFAPLFTKMVDLVGTSLAENFK